MKYICSNCGNLQNTIGENSGCAHDFWGITLFITIMIAIFIPVAWVVIGFEILFFILTGRSSNCCNKCNAKDCVIPVNTPRGEKIHNEYYNKIEEE